MANAETNTNVGQFVICTNKTEQLDNKYMNFWKIKESKSLIGDMNIWSLGIDKASKTTTATCDNSLIF